MNKTEAQGLLADQIANLRGRPYAELRERLDESETVEVLGPSGTTYYVQTQVFWDGRRGENLRVLVAIDDGGWRAFSPLGDSFIMAPDGSFVGE